MMALITTIVTNFTRNSINFVILTSNKLHLWGLFFFCNTALQLQRRRSARPALILVLHSSRASVQEEEQTEANQNDCETYQKAEEALTHCGIECHREELRAVLEKVNHVAPPRRSGAWAISSRPHAR